MLLSNFQHLLVSRVNSLVILRPRLNSRERTEQIADVLSFVGDEYDFSFDLTDASDQVCTELIYRSLQGRGGIDLPLTEHAGRLTLTADEILKYGMISGGNFDCVLAVDEAPNAAGTARILHGTKAREWVIRLPGMVP